MEVASMQLEPIPLIKSGAFLGSLRRCWADFGGFEAMDLMTVFDCYFMYPPQPGSIVPLFVRATTNWISPVDPQPKFVIKAGKGAFVKHYEDGQWLALEVRKRE
ncbi:hypothetical protein N7456_008234 [Penicillium angulare]|uniref:Uncharacterized protein n=1 Tax=Penicillium angulare TaxID=116970 RepID=A0A9W9K908_9EURO|nr:hypothetical protein N7456_008234 [Penicillium angulare]